MRDITSPSSAQMSALNTSMPSDGMMSLSMSSNQLTAAMTSSVQPQGVDDKGIGRSHSRKSIASSGSRSRSRSHDKLSSSLPGQIGNNQVKKISRGAPQGGEQGRKDKLPNMLPSNSRAWNVEIIEEEFPEVGE